MKFKTKCSSCGYINEMSNPLLEDYECENCEAWCCTKVIDVIIKKKGEKNG